jgi:hypothetical protein
VLLLGLLGCYQVVQIAPRFGVMPVCWQNLVSKIRDDLLLCFQGFEKSCMILLIQIHSWHVRCLRVGMAVFIKTKSSQKFDDSHFFQRLTLIDICCGPPVQA